MQGYSGTTQPQGRRSTLPIQPLYGSSPCTPAASRLPHRGARRGTHQAPRHGHSQGPGTPLCSQTQYGKEVGSRLPHSHRRGGRRSHVPTNPVGRGPGLAWRWQRGCRWDAPPRRSQVTARQKARGSLSPRAGTHARGAGTVPWQTPSTLPGLAREEEPQQKARQLWQGSRHRRPQRAVSCSFPPSLPAGCRPLPALSTPVSPSLFCQVPPGKGLNASLLPSPDYSSHKASSRGREHPAPAHLQGEPEKATKSGRGSRGGSRFGSSHLLPLHACPAQPVSGADQPTSSSSAQPRGCLSTARLLPQGSLAGEAPRYFNPALSHPSQRAWLRVQPQKSSAPHKPPHPAAGQDGETPRGCARRSQARHGTGLEGSKSSARAGCSPPAATSAPAPPPREELQVQSSSRRLGRVPLLLGTGCTLHGNREQDWGLSLVLPDRRSDFTLEGN